MAPVASAVNRPRRVDEVAVRLPRIAIEAVSPAVDDGRFPVKRTVGELVGDLYMGRPPFLDPSRLSADRFSGTASVLREVNII